MKNYKKHGIIIFVFIVLSIIFSSLIKEKKTIDSFMNTIYTISGIMFSIGMGILCTTNPDKIKNIQIYMQVKESILSVRNNYIAYFSLISFCYLFYQVFPEFYFGIFDLNIAIKKVPIIFTIKYATIFLNILGILYFIFNFIEIQKLNFDISDKTRSKDKTYGNSKP
ncbi:hypothetical protein ACTHSK_03360 [Neisseria sp. P0012.S006]|jgi:hypothetical protein|uniref:hypothetical protein n=1 Tax=unclassified Neisseria TaxID=2623750 RepID=UPI003F7FF1EB